MGLLETSVVTVPLIQSACPLAQTVHVNYLWLQLQRYLIRIYSVSLNTLSFKPYNVVKLGCLVIYHEHTDPRSLNEAREIKVVCVVKLEV